jgi:branched-chain amino acid transport system ATP-binding protein
MFELRNVSAGYDTGRVLHDVTISVPKGSVVALLGPNGAGKTTLLRVASGLLRVDSGDVVLNDRALTGAPTHAFSLAGVCHVPEGRGIFATLTVADNLRLQAPPGREKAAREVATSVFPRLGERLGQLAGTMSGGEQQMLALARTYLSQPQVALLDEVSMGLAPKIVDEIFLYLKGLAESGTSLLLVEQYVSRALELADYVYLMNGGRIVFAGEPCELDEERLAESYLGAHA